jgi:hypothetical protein
VWRVFLPRLVNAVRAVVRPSAARNANTHHIKIESLFISIQQERSFIASEEICSGGGGEPGGLGCRLEEIGAHRCFLHPIKLGGG